MDVSSTYEKRFVPVVYDALVRSIFVPVGGERRLRRDAVARLGLAGGEKILELGCGTGSFTRLLLGAGASVRAVDGSSAMLARARVKAPGADLVRADLATLELEDGARFDVVLMAFVLHELEPSVRSDLFARSARVLAPGGRVAIVDHAVPRSGWFARLWRRFLLRLEPPTVRAVIERGFDDELRVAGLRTAATFALAGGTAQLVLAEPRGAERPVEGSRA